MTPSVRRWNDRTADDQTTTETVSRRFAKRAINRARDRSELLASLENVTGLLVMLLTCAPFNARTEGQIKLDAQVIGTAREAILHARRKQ